jgi:MFS family permease
MIRGPHRTIDAAWALVLAYASFGFFWGTWVVVFSDFLHLHDLTPGGASSALVALSVTSIAVMILATPRLESWPRRSSLSLAFGLQAVGAVGIALAPTGLLLPVFALTGAGTGLIDVFVNAAASEVEIAGGRPVLQWVYAGYSFGGVLGALGTGLLLSGGAESAWPLVLAAAVQVAAATMCKFKVFFQEGRAKLERPAGSSLSVFVRAPLLLVPALVVMSTFFIEGSMDVWSVIYLRRTLGASTIAGSLGFSAFGLAMGTGRIFAASILFRMGRRRTISWSAAGSILAAAVAVTTSNPVIASIAFLVLGFSMAAAAPAAFGVAGGPAAGVVVAAITTVGYTGFVVGPPIMGWLADEIGLRATMAALMVATAGIGAGAMLPWPQPDVSEEKGASSLR